MYQVYATWQIIIYNINTINHNHKKNNAQTIVKNSNLKL